MGEGDYIESLINEYEIILGKRELKDAQGEYDESGIQKFCFGRLECIWRKRALETCDATEHLCCAMR